MRECTVSMETYSIYGEYSIYGDIQYNSSLIEHVIRGSPARHEPGR